MKKVLASSVVVLMVLFLSAGIGLAGDGKGSGTGTGGSGDCEGTGVPTVCEGDTVTITGIVSGVSVLGAGDGLEIDTDTGAVIVYGIGPYWFWEDKGIARPAIGDEVTVDGMAVTFTSGIKIIAMSITVHGVPLPLRVACDVVGGGQPLWSGGRNSQTTAQ